MTILNIYASNTGVLNYIKNTLMDLKAQVDPYTVIVGDLNTPLLSIDSHPSKKVNKDTSELIQVRLNRHNKHLLNISPNHQARPILFSSSWNFLQNRFYFKTQSKS
jgi:hypothetical protein